MKFIAKNKFFNYYLPFILSVFLIVAGVFVYQIFNNPPQASATTVTFSTVVNGGSTWQVPAGVSSINVKAWGAGGGGGGTNTNIGGTGGAGGFASSTISVTPLENLTVYVGGAGGFSVTNAGGGGGYSGVQRASNFLIMAGGGGGGGAGSSNAAGQAGGAGGGNSGVAGGGASSAGGAGTSSAGGAGGVSSGTNGSVVSNTGGTGGIAGGGGAAGTNGGGAGGTGASSGGGGGGGNFGGGGGGSASIHPGGGGGGSDLVTGSPTGEVAGSGTTPGNNTDTNYTGSVGVGGSAGAGGNNGYVVITYTVSAGGVPSMGINARGGVKVRGGSSSASSPWYSTGGTWLYRKQITILHGQVSGAGNLTNFPVLISTTTDAQLSAHALSTGNDILFTGNDGVTKLNYAREKYVNGTGELEAWVQVPSVSPTVDTTIYMYYGNASSGDQQSAAATWNDGGSNFYKAVYHMADNAATKTVTDDLAAHNAVSVNNTSAITTTGKVDGAFTFDGSTEFASTTDSSDMQSPNIRTISFWMNPTLAGSATMRVLTEYQSGTVGSPSCSGNCWNIMADDASATTHLADIQADLVVGGVEHAIASPNNSITTGVWNYIAVTFDGTQPTAIYINGTSQTTSAGGAPYSTNATVRMVMGADQGGGHIFTGTLDEVHFSTTARSADWIKTEYNNQSSPNSFDTFGAEATQSSAGRVIFR